MAAAEHFDVVVVGRSLAGLLTASLLARRKYRVRVMDCQGAAPLEQVPLFGDTSRVVGRVLDELGLQHDLRTRLDGAWKPVTLALPDRRGVLPTTLADRGRELGELFGGHSAALVALFDAVERYGESLDPMLADDIAAPFGWSSRRAWNRALDGTAARRLADDPEPWTSDEAVRPMIRALLRVAGQNDDAQGAMTARGARALWHLCHGVVPIRDGRAGFARMVSEKLDVLGGSLDRSGQQRPATGFEVQRRRVRAVETADGSRIGAEVVILAGGEPDLARLWPEAPAPAMVRGQRLSVRVAAEDRPPDLRDPCGWIPVAGGPAHLVRVADDQMVLSWVGPGTPPLDRLLPFARFEVGDAAMLPFPVDGRHDALGLYARPYQGPLKNLLFTGEWVLPGLGLEGACFTAWQAAAEVERVGPKRRRG
jgi:phytoene dehydrogenase-like protein